MTKTVSRKPAKANGRTTNDAVADTKRAAKSSKKRSSHFQDGKLPLKSIIGIGTIILVIAAVLVGFRVVPAFKMPFKDRALQEGSASFKERKVNTQANGVEKKGSTTKSKGMYAQDLPKEFQNFKLSVQSTLSMKNIKENNHQMKIHELKHENSKSHVHAYVVENFLSENECNSLAMVHRAHVSELKKQVPIICFDSVKSFREYLKDAMLKIKVSQSDFTEGTTCINETFSAKLQAHFKWSFSTAFYPGESKFSTIFAQRIQRATGLKLENGGKFQITSYPKDVGYKNHTDCLVNHGEKRDRFATILVYLRDVEEGGETKFPQLGISVKPQMGLALIWNSMNSKGECDPTSIHNAAKVVKGHKFIIQRWYYYHNFPSLGRRPEEPRLPPRSANQPRVSCDEYEQGSCRWYDEWNYDHLMDYTANLQNLI